MRAPDHHSLWRSLIPTWRFFDRVAPGVRVYVSVDGGPFASALPRPPRRWFNLLFNPAANLHHADENLVVRLIEETAGLAEPRELTTLTSYRLLVRRLYPVGAAAWRFKITIGADDVIISPPFGPNA